MLGATRSGFTRTMRLGSAGEDVRQLQELLRKAGFDPGPVDGSFGSKVQAAVLAFQRSHGLQADGAVGPLTLAALSQAVVAGNAPAGHTPKGLSLHIGLNQVDTTAYGFNVPDLAGCVNDANDMQDLAKQKGFRYRQLLNSAATSAAVIAAIEEAARNLQAGDIFWITYSGHGSQVPDPAEDDQRSETWVLWDRQLIDNELYGLWSRFQAGVRLLLISDSCHSGTVSRQLEQLNSESTAAADAARTGGPAQRTVITPDLAVEWAFGLVDALTPLQAAGSLPARVGGARSLALQVIRYIAAPSADRGISTPAVERARLLDPVRAAEDVRTRASEYQRATAQRAATEAPVCSVLLISGCQDNQTSSDGRPDPLGHQNGAFTKALRDVWTTAGDYADLHAKILQQMSSPTQSPNLYWATPRDAAFEARSPFTI